MLRNLDIFKLETPSHTTRRVALANGGEAFPYSDLSVGRIEGFQRTIPALVSDGVADGDNWYVVNLIDASNGMSRYVQSVAVLGATSEEQAREWALKNIGLFVGANDAWNTAYTSTKVLKTYLNRPSTSVAMIAIRQSDLDTIAAQITDKPVVWDGSRLVSHDATSLLHELVKHDDEVMMMDAMTPADLPILMVEMGGELAEYDALIVDYNRLDLLMNRLNTAMQKSSVGNVKPTNITQSKPFKRNGVTNVASLFEMSDGQSITIVFHSPDNTPAKLSPSDTLTSWKWMLNKRDISAAVSPKNGENVQMPDLAKRILTIVEKNSARFIRANGNKAAQIQELSDTNTRIGQKQEALAGILAVNKDLQKQIDEAGKQPDPSKIDFKEGDYVRFTPAIKSDLKQSFEGMVISLNSTTGGAWRVDVRTNKPLPRGDGFIEKRAYTDEGTFLKIDEPVVNDWRKTMYAKEVAQGVWRMAHKSNDNPVSPSYFTKEEAENAEDIYTRTGDYPKADEKNQQVNGDGRITPDTAGNMKNGDIVRTKDGTEFMSLGARHDWLEVAPMINGKPLVNSEDTFKFLLSPEKASAYPERRNEPIYPTGKNYYSDNKGQEPVAPVATPTPAAKSTDLTEGRPSNWRTNLANARAVAKSLGIETKGKKLERLVKEIDFFDENEIKKQVLVEFKDLAGRLVLPNSYVFDLSNAEKSIDDLSYFDISAWIKKQGKTDTNSIRIELRVVPDLTLGTIYNSIIIYSDDPKVKSDFSKNSYIKFDKILGSGATTPKEIVANMEQFLIKAVFPKIEYLKVVNSTDVDVSKLSEIGIAEITDIGNENLYFEKDGKFYISKVGNTENYALGEWDFSQYPDGKPAAPVQPANEPPMTNPDRDYLQSIIDGEADLSNGDDVEAKLTDISERLDAELEPMFEQAAEAFAQYAIAQAATV